MACVSSLRKPLICSIIEYSKMQAPTIPTNISTKRFPMQPPVLDEKLYRHFEQAVFTLVRDPDYDSRNDTKSALDDFFLLVGRVHRVRPVLYAGQIIPHARKRFRRVLTKRRKHRKDGQ